tara:strand:+ start:793 stop:1083 length:291 start_codon:yes stop_codon:yes gene_type:complete
MNIEIEELQEMQRIISDRIFIRVESWNLYLGDAGLSEALATACSANLDKGANIAARKALDQVHVNLGGGNVQLPLTQLISAGQIFDLEEILEPYCK